MDLHTAKNPDEIGRCIICDQPVYPVDEREAELADGGPVMHSACGW